MNKLNLFTSESVSEGHPDKVCDQIADSILDYCLSIDPKSRVACEVFATKNYVLIGGEITSKAKPDYKKIVKNVLTDIGYTKKEYGFSADEVKVEVRVQEQSHDIAMGVDAKKDEDIGAGDHIGRLLPRRRWMASSAPHQGRCGLGGRYVLYGDGQRPVAARPEGFHPCRAGRRDEGALHHHVRADCMRRGVGDIP